MRVATHCCVRLASVHSQRLLKKQLGAFCIQNQAALIILWLQADRFWNDWMSDKQMAFKDQARDPEIHQTNQGNQ